MKKSTDVLTGAVLSDMGHMFTAACQGLLSLLQKLPLFWSINMLLCSLFSLHANEHTVRLGTDSYLCPTRHVNTDMQMQFFCTFLWYVNSRNPESLHTWLLKAQQKNRFDSVLNPLKEQRCVMCESSKSTACYTFIFTCNHFLPSTTQNPPLPSSSLSKYGLI